LGAALKDLDHTYEFHCAIQRIEQAHPEAIPLGEGSDPQKEAVVLKAHVSDAIPDYEVDRIEADRARPVLWMNLVSLGGRAGPLPEVYTDMLKERIRHKDMGFRDFLDVFNHRVASLWYRLRKKFLPGFVPQPAKKTPIGEAGLCLAGIPHTKLIANTTLRPSTMVAAQGLLWAQHRSVEGLKTLLEDYFHHVVKIEPWQGGWNNISDEEVTCLGGPWNRLGHDTLLGKRSWNTVQGLRIHVYGVDAQSDFPVAEWRDVIALYVGVRMRIYVRLHYTPETVRGVRLRPAYGHFLGRNTWVAKDHTSVVKPCYEFLIRYAVSA
jgi:type VI secretion system protein ImpH